VRRIEVMAVQSVTPPRQRRSVVIEDHVLVHQRFCAEALELADPRVHARVVLVVAGDEISPCRDSSRASGSVWCARSGTLPSTTSPVIAIMSACRRLTRSTIAATKLRLIVCRYECR